MRPNPMITRILAIAVGVAIAIPATLSPAFAQVMTGDQEPIRQVELTPPELFSMEDADLVITLPDAVRKALDESFDIYRLQEKYVQLSYGLEAARRSLRTRVFLDSSLPRIQEGYINILYTDFEGTLDLWSFDQSIRQLATSLNVVQPLITDGRITLSSRISAYQRSLMRLPAGDDARLRYLMPTLKIEYNQPLFQYNYIRGYLKQARLDLESLQLSYSEVELNRINDVTRAFYELFGSQHMQQIAAEAFQQSTVNYQSGVRMYELGMISEIENLNLGVEMVNSLDRLLKAKRDLEEAQLDFKRAIGIDIEDRIWVEASEEFRPVEVSLERALQLASQNRSNIRQAQIEVDKIDLDIRKVESQGRPDLQLNFGYDLSWNTTLAKDPGLAPDALMPWSDHFSAAFDPAYKIPNTNVTISLKVPLFDWRTNDARVQRLMSERRVLNRDVYEAEENLYRDVVSRVGSIDDAMQRMEMQIGNRQISRSAYEISQQQFERGEITYTELLLAQQRYLRTETLFTEALIDYEMAKAELREITMWDWETNRPVQQRTTPPEPFREGR